MNGAVLTERPNPHTLLITINRPDAMNAINRDVHVGIGTTLEEAEQDPDIRVIVLTGAGERAFTAGADLKAVGRGETLMPDDPVQRAWGFAGFCTHAISKPVIAAVNGFALGGGTEIVLHADLAVASDHAQFGLPEVKRGLLAGAGGAFRIGRAVPRKLAMEILLTGAPISAGRAYEIGLINAVAPRGEAVSLALDYAALIAANAPLAVQASKRVALGIMDGGMGHEDESWARSTKESAALMRSADTREGVRAFAEKREPVWQGR
jgi:crotonobetainyl-CoA hydratase